MVKFKKRVTKHKISGFFKSAPLILFFHGIDRKDFYKTFNQFLITEKSSSLKTERESKALQCKDLYFLKKRSDSIPEIEKRIALQGLIVKSIKNNYAKKYLQQFLVNERFQENSILKSENTEKVFLNKINDPQITGKMSSNKEDRRNHSSRDTLKELNPNLFSLKNESQENQLLTNSLFQGKILCLGFDNLSFLGEIQSFLEKKNHYVLGAFYDNNIIDQSTVNRLASICQNSTAYPLYLQLLKTCNNRLIGNLSNLLDFSYLLSPQTKLIALMKILHQHKIRGDLQES